MARWAHCTRATLQAQGDYYLCPLGTKQVPDDLLEAYLQPIWAGEQGGAGGVA